MRANGQIMKFAGYTKVYEVAETDDAKAEAADEADRLLPPMEVGDAIVLETVRPEQHFTQPPPRFSEASLVKELEERGIGRPSTYAAIMSTIVDRGYVEKKEARFFPTELGILVNGLLVVSFPEIVDADFTAKMEADLDHVEDGTEDWRKLLGEFYTPFKLELEKAETEMRDVKREEIATEWSCEKCGKPMVIKWGRNGAFLACQGYPECRNTRRSCKNLDGTWEKVPPQTTDEVCETCGAPMTVKRGRFGSFLACTKYPECKTTKPISLGVKCPKPGCGGFIAEKRSRRGKPFYGCSNWAKKRLRLRRVGQADPAAVPDLPSEVRAAQGDQGRHQAALHGVRLEERRRGRDRGERGVADVAGRRDRRHVRRDLCRRFSPVLRSRCAAGRAPAAAPSCSATSRRAGCSSPMASAGSSRSIAARRVRASSCAATRARSCRAICGPRACAMGFRRRACSTVEDCSGRALCVEFYTCRPTSRLTTGCSTRRSASADMRRSGRR